MAKVGEGDARWIVEDRKDGTNVSGWHWCAGKRKRCVARERRLANARRGAATRASRIRTPAAAQQACSDWALTHGAANQG